MNCICERGGEKPSSFITALALRADGAVHSFTERTLTGRLDPTRGRAVSNFSQELPLVQSSFAPASCVCHLGFCSHHAILWHYYLFCLLTICLVSDSCFHHLLKSSQHMVDSPVLPAVLYPQFTGGHGCEKRKEKASVAVLSCGRGMGSPFPLRTIQQLSLPRVKASPLLFVGLNGTMLKESEGCSVMSNCL